MMFIVAVTVVLAAAVGAARFGLKVQQSHSYALSDSTAHGDGPVTLEELFAARYTRGEIDLRQYRAFAGRVAAQLHT